MGEAMEGPLSPPVHEDTPSSWSGLRESLFLGASWDPGLTPFLSWIREMSSCFTEGGWGRARRILRSFKSRSSPLLPSPPQAPSSLPQADPHAHPLFCTYTAFSLAAIASRGVVTAEQLLVAAPTSRLRRPVKVSGALGVRVEPGRLGQQGAWSASRRRCGQGALWAGGAARPQTSALSGKLRRLPSVLARWAVASSSSPQGAPRRRVLCRPAFLPLRPGGGARGRRRHAVPAVEAPLRYVGTLEDS